MIDEEDGIFDAIKLQIEHDSGETEEWYFSISVMKRMNDWKSSVLLSGVIETPSLSSMIPLWGNEWISNPFLSWHVGDKLSFE